MVVVHAEVAELVDALGSGSSGGFPVRVRVSPSAPQIINTKSAVSILRFSFLLFDSLQMDAGNNNERNNGRVRRG